jgi:hypothetical protein
MRLQPKEERHQCPQNTFMKPPIFLVVLLLHFKEPVRTCLSLKRNVIQPGISDQQD